jgi:hypothetical protein
MACELIKNRWMGDGEKRMEAAQFDGEIRRAIFIQDRTAEAIRRILEDRLIQEGILERSGELAGPRLGNG